MTIKAESRAAMDRQLAAELIARAHALRDGTKGVMVTRHNSNLFTIALSEEFPYGLTEERRIW